MANLQKTSILLNGGMDEQSQSELAGPIAGQGASITLRKSLNTRLSKVPGSCVRAPDASVSDTLNSKLFGLVPSVAGRNILAVHAPGVGSEILTEAAAAAPAIGAGGLKADKLGVSRPNSWVPAQVSGAGALPSCASESPPVTCSDTNGDFIWSAWVRVDPETGDAFVVVSVSSYSGAIVAPATAVASLSATTDHWVALTNHHASGIRLWFKGGTQLHATRLTLAGNTITPVGLNSRSWAWGIYPTVVSGVYVDHAGSVTATYADYAYFAADATAGFGRLVRIDVNSYVATQVTYPLAVAGFPDAAICFTDLGGGSLAVATAFQGGGLLQSIVANPNTLAGIYAANTAQPDGTVAIQPYQHASGSGFVIAVSPAQPFVGNTFPAVTSFYQMTGTLSLSYEIPFTRLYSKGAAVRFAAGETYPLFDTVGCFADSLVLPTSPEYTLDPAIVVYLAGTPQVISPVARFACPRSTLSPVRIDGTATPRQSACALPFGGRPEVRFQWSKDVLLFSSDDDPENPRGNTAELSYPGRFTHLSFAQHQPTVVHDKSGVAFVAGALPVQWDGEQVVEVGGPLWAPHLQVQSAAAGTGDTYPAGDYQFGVHFEWFDAAGLQHRSAPAVINWTSAGSKPLLTASAPTGLKDNVGRTAAAAVFFATENNGAVLHRLKSVPMSGTYVVDFSAVPLADGARQPIYSTGEVAQAQPPSPPPPTLDWCIVGDRVVGIDAECRDRLFASKRRASGIGFEFAPFYEVLLPAGAGDAVAVREWQGTIVCFTKNAIYQIATSGGGPDNLVGNPSGGAFSAPIRVASVGCENKDSVLVTPKGIIFQRGTEMLFFTGGEPTPLSGAEFAEPVSGAFLLPSDDEAVVVLHDVCKVFNYRANRWTRWEIFQGNSQFFVVDVPWDNNQILLAEAGTAPKLRMLDSSQLSQTAEMQWETDWVVLGGDFEDRVNLQWVVLNGVAVSPCSMDVEILTNYDEQKFVDRATTPNSTLRVVENLSGRFVHKIDPMRKDSRAVKLRLTETDVGEVREGLRPISITFYYRIEAQSNETAFVQGSRH